MFGGFRERADATYALLQAPGTAFLVVAAPEPDALREASYFVERLAAEQMPLAGLVLNRVHRTPLPDAVGRAQRWRPPSGWTSPATHDLDAPGCCGCTPSGSQQVGRASSTCATGSPRRTPRCRSRRGAGAADRRPRPGRAARGSAPRCADRRPLSGRAAADAAARCDGVSGSRCRSSRRWLVLVAGGLEQPPPGRDVRPAAQQRPALALGHAAPDAELDPVVQGVGQALGAHRAAHADGLGAVLRGPLHEQRVRVSCPGRRPASLQSLVQSMLPEGTEWDSVVRQARTVQSHAEPEGTMDIRATGPVAPTSPPRSCGPPYRQVADARAGARDVTGPAHPSRTLVDPWHVPGSATRPRHARGAVLVAAVSVVSGVLVAGLLPLPFVGCRRSWPRRPPGTSRTCPASWSRRRCPQQSDPARRRRDDRSGDDLLREPHRRAARPDQPDAAAGDRRDRGLPVLRARRRRPARRSLRALVTNAQGRRSQQGGSTLTQQYVKNVLVTDRDQRRGARGRHRAARLTPQAAEMRLRHSAWRSADQGPDPRALPQHRLLRRRGVRRRGGGARTTSACTRGQLTLAAGRDRSPASSSSPSATTRSRNPKLLAGATRHRARADARAGRHHPTPTRRRRRPRRSSRRCKPKPPPQRLHQLVRAVLLRLRAQGHQDRPGLRQDARPTARRCSTAAA